MFRLLDCQMKFRPTRLTGGTFFFCAFDSAKPNTLKKPHYFIANYVNCMYD